MCVKTYHFDHSRIWLLLLRFVSLLLALAHSHHHSYRLFFHFLGRSIRIQSSPPPLPPLINIGPSFLPPLVVLSTPSMSVTASVPAADVSGGVQMSADVARQFVEQYYRVLETKREIAHKFYQEGSLFSRPSADGKLFLITTTDEIREEIIAMGEVKPTLKSVDVQPSLSSGVFILVRGCLTGTDNISRDFTQSFFLAPQDNGFYVLNDIFRYDKDDPLEGYQGFPNGLDASAFVEHVVDTLQQQDQRGMEHIAAPPAKDTEANDNEVYNNDMSLVVGEGAPSSQIINEVLETSPSSKVIEKNPSTAPSHEMIGGVSNNSLNSVVIHEVLDGVDIMAETGFNISSQEGGKKSYASILKAMKSTGHIPGVPAWSPVSPAAPVPSSAPVNQAKADEDAASPVPATAATDAPTCTSSASESSYTQEAEVDGYSVYIKNLPLDTTSAQLEEEFKKFGSIKPNGIQVRSNKLQGFCYGFVEFEVASAVQNAIQASPIIIGHRQAYIEEKRLTGPRGSDRSRNLSGRGGGFRIYGGRGQSIYGSGRGYGRTDFGKRADFGGRVGGRGSSVGRSSFGYQKVYHARSNGEDRRNPVSATSDQS